MARDPFHYFRIESREHVDGLTAGVLELEKRNDDCDVAARLLRHAHTLKGAARVVKQVEISELSHAIEEILGPVRDGQRIASREDINKLLQLIDAIADGIKALSDSDPSVGAGADRPPASGTVGEPTVAKLDAVHIEIAELDPLLHGIWEARIKLGLLRDQSATLDRLIQSAHSLTDEAQVPRTGAMVAHTSGAGGVGAVADDIHTTLKQLRQTIVDVADKNGRELLQLQDRALQLRLLPASSVFGSLARAARDTADGLGRQIEFRTHGGDNRLDAHVLRALHDALLHVVRNAVSHGVERSDERVAAGKPPAGRVEVSVERRGNRVIFVCRDDGRGVDIDRIRQAAIDRGLHSAAEDTPLSLEDAVRILLRGGVTTAASVNEHAGRGIGLDVVRETVDRLKGDVEMQSTPSTGTTVTLSVPVSLESMSVLEVEVAGQRICIPFEAIRGVLLVPDSDIARSPEGDSIIFEGVHTPLLSLRRLLFPTASAELSSAAARIVVIKAGQVQAAIVVDRPLKRSAIILKPLPTIVGRLDFVMGSCLDASGDPIPVLDPSSLVEAAGGSGSATIPAEPQARHRVLVIDDSLTSRMLEQSILETAGFDVDVAASGEQALARVKQQSYAIFIVDVEMPGMNGYQFIEQVKSDPDLRDIPAILVTSRAGQEDRARGESVGAAAHIVKAEFEEAGFLRTIRRLIR